MIKLHIVSHHILLILKIDFRPGAENTWLFFKTYWLCAMILAVRLFTTCYSQQI